MKLKSLANHNISVLFWVQFFSTVSFLQPILTLFYFERGLTAPDIFIVLLCWSSGVLVGEIPTGIFADRFGPKVAFITGAIIKLFSITLFLVAYDSWIFYILSALSGLSASFFSGADEALLYESLKESGEQNKMDAAMGKVQSAGFISSLVTAIIGAIYAKDLQNDQFVVLISLSIAAQLLVILLLFLIKSPPKVAESTQHPWKLLKLGAKEIYRTPQLLIMFMNVTLVFIPAVAVFDNFVQLLLTNEGLPVPFLGILYSCAALIGFFSSRSIGYLTNKFSSILLMYGTGFLSVGCLLLSAYFQDSLGMLLGVFLVLQFVRAIRYPIYSQISNDIIPSHVRATTISLLSILDSVFDLIVFASLYTVALSGFQSIFVGCAIIALIGTLLPIKKKFVQVE
ncbi:MFS transporter [Bacillus spongiae]|uniref:MFS transporter n=1 Tax=Bacillus spongiae TaxID=2683610 RepID=A0ABU8HGJ3_9BACI